MPRSLRMLDTVVQTVVLTECIFRTLQIPEYSKLT